jgi:hypothetical protein
MLIIVSLKLILLQSMKRIIFSTIILSIFTISVQAQKLFPILLKEKWGYMNQEGKVVITPKYDIAQDFNEGFAVVALGNMPCLIDRNEKRVIDTGLYQFISRYNEGSCAVRDFKKRWFYIDGNGSTILKLDSFIYEANPFNNGLARVSRQQDDVTQKFGFDISNLSYRFAYINKKGKYVSEFKYRDAEDFDNNIARVKENMMTYLVNTTFEKKCDETTEIGKFNDGLAVFIDNGKFGYMNLNGEKIIAANFDYASMFYNGLAEVEMNGKSCFIDTLGNKKFEPIYEELRPYAEGFAGYKQNNKYGFVNSKGEMMMQPYYDDVAYFNNGLCPVRKGQNWGAINKEGKLILKLEFDFVSPFEDGIAEVIYKGVSLYADTKGNLLPIWE